MLGSQWREQSQDCYIKAIHISLKRSANNIDFPKGERYETVPCGSSDANFVQLDAVDKIAACCQNVKHISEKYYAFASPIAAFNVNSPTTNGRVSQHFSQSL